MKHAIRDGNSVLRAYLTAAFVIFVAVKIAEFTLPVQTVRIIRYSEIVLNTAMAAWIYTAYGRTKPQSRENLIALGLAITCAADFFLTLNGGGAMFTPGVTLFCVAETVYAVYLKPDRINLTFRAILFALLAVIAWRLGLITAGILLGVLNLSLLAGNVLAAWTLYRKDKDRLSLLFALGMTFFLICDINVGLEVLAAEGTAIYAMAYFIVWTVYIPAQVLIVVTYNQRIQA